MNRNIKQFSLMTLLPLVFVCAISFCLGGCGGVERAGQAETIHLFNGKDLDHFYTFVKDRGRNNDSKKVFTVKDGVIHISGEEWGCITTNREYENYHLVAEYKWGDKTFGQRKENAKGCGIFVHTVGEDGTALESWAYGIEIQIIEGGTGDFLVIGDKSENYMLTCPVAEEKQGEFYTYQPDGKLKTINYGRINWWGRDPEWQDVKGFRGEKDVEKPVGQWNRLEIIVKGPIIQVILNGVLVNECTDVQPRKGKILVQSEGAEVFIRQLDLIKLTD